MCHHAAWAAPVRVYQRSHDIGSITGTFHGEKGVCWGVLISGQSNTHLTAMRRCCSCGLHWSSLWPALQRGLCTSGLGVCVHSHHQHQGSSSQAAGLLAKVAALYAIRRTPTLCIVLTLPVFDLQIGAGQQPSYQTYLLCREATACLGSLVCL